MPILPAFSGLVVCMTSLQCVFHELPLRFRSRNCHPDLRRELPCGEKILMVLDNIEVQLHLLPSGTAVNHAEHACMKAGRESFYAYAPHLEGVVQNSICHSVPFHCSSSAQQIPIAVAAYFALASVAVVSSVGLDQRTTIRTSPHHLTCSFLDLGHLP